MFGLWALCFLQFFLAPAIRQVAHANSAVHAKLCTQYTHIIYQGTNEEGEKIRDMILLEPDEYDVMGGRTIFYKQQEGETQKTQYIVGCDWQRKIPIVMALKEPDENGNGEVFSIGRFYTTEEEFTVKLLPGERVAADGSLESWLPLTHCFYEGSRQQHSCQVDDLDFLQYYQVRFAELCEDSALDSLYNWTHPILIRGALAGSPVNITMTVLSQSDVHIGWDASTSASDCSFYAWEVQWRLASSVEWTSAAECQDLIYRNQTECIIRELSAMTSYVVRITETCTDVRTNSLPADTPTFRFREVDDWEIYVGPSAGMTLAVSTLSKEVDHCEVITTCCDDQFSLCYSTTSTEELTASVSRTDFVAGWGQQLWLHCFANGINPLSEEIPSAAPQWIELQNPSRSGMSASYSLGQAPGHCLCAHPHLQLKAADDTAWVSYGGDCADMSLRACSLTDLVPDRIYMARLQVACANSSLNSPWTYSVEATTDPGCKWSSSSGNGTGYECQDGSFCASPGCCSGNLLRCPDVMPIMCSDGSCSGDHCCVASSSGCAAHGGVRLGSTALPRGEADSEGAA